MRPLEMKAAARGNDSCDCAGNSDFGHGEGAGGGEDGGGWHTPLN